MMVQEGEGGGEWIFVSDLRRSAAVEAVQPGAKEIAADVKVLVVVHPKSLSDETLYAIDQFVLRGGRLIVAVDPFSRVDLAGSGAMARMQGQMPQASSNLERLFKAWGVEFVGNQIVGDPSYAAQINAGGEVLAYPYFMALTEAAFDKSSVITANLKQMLIAEGGAISLADGATSKLEPLITTTKDAGTADATVAAFMGPQDLARQLKSDQKPRMIAGLLHGKLKSAFPDGRPKPAAEPKEGEPPPPSTPHIAESADGSEASVVIIADADFLADQNSADRLRFANQVMVRPRNDNLSFLSNAVDFLGGSPDLIAIRSRGRIARPFTRVIDLQKAAQTRWQAEEDKLTSELTDLQKKLNELQSQRTDGNRLVMTPEQQAEMQRFRDREREVRSARRAVRRNLREDIERLGHRLIALNMLVVPLATSVFGLGVFVARARRRQRKEGGKSHG
jgi:ABC-type uncharacterized transport system involved in gliding motility auxiliary subunit